MRELRLKLGRSQEDLAAAVGCSRIHISRIESGLKRPSVELLRKLAEALQTTAGFLIESEPTQEGRHAR